MGKQRRDFQSSAAKSYLMNGHYNAIIWVILRIFINTVYPIYELRWHTVISNVSVIN